MTVDELIDGFIQLCRSVTEVRSVYGKARQIYSTSGITAHATAMVAYNLYNKFDALRKENALRHNREQIAVGGLSKK